MVRNEVGGPVVKTMGRTMKPIAGAPIEGRMTGKSIPPRAATLYAEEDVAGTCDDITVN